MLRILVVEDFAPFRRLVCTALQKFETTEAADGLEGVQKAEQLQPDLILLDINLPKLHGFGVAQRIRQVAPRARLIFLSQESSPDIVRRALRLGAHGYVQKLSAATDLLRAIETVLSGRRFVSRSVEYADPADAPQSPARHEMRFCPDFAATVDALAHFMATALNAGDAAIAVVTAANREPLLQRLRNQVADIDGAIARGLCLPLAADDLSDADRFLEVINGARDAAARFGKAHPRVVACGDRAGQLWAEGRVDEVIHVERLCRLLPHDVDILCVYPVPHDKDDEALMRVCAEHTAVLGS
jgi:two-component system nitrate/nitrite response regulator NarL